MGKGYSLSERIKKEVAEKTGIPYEELINMSPEEIRIRIEKKTGELIPYDLTQVVSTTILYDDSHSEQKNTIVESIQKSIPQNGSRIELNAEDENITGIISSLWDMMQKRAKEGVAAKEAGRGLPDFPRIVIFVYYPTRITDLVDETSRIHLVAMISKLSLGYHMHFVIIENQKNIIELIQGKCLGLLYPVIDGVLLSTDKSAYILFHEDISFDATPRSPYGYVVQNKDAKMVKIELEGKNNE